MKVFWTGVAVLGAFLLQTALSLVLPPSASRLVDPFLLVLVYCGLAFGETHAMLAGSASGWIQDVQFGGQVVGLSGLCKGLIGFGVGVAATRFQLTEAGPRTLVLLLAALLDALLLVGLAATFDIAVARPSAGGMLLRAALNAVLGVVAFELLDRRLLQRRWRA